jgi:hypothetical protein
MKIMRIILVLILFLFNTVVKADQIIKGCAPAFLGGEICPIDPRGTLVLDFLGNAKCAPGQCVFDFLGNAICAARSEGRIILDTLGQPTCQGGCIRPAARFCEKLG